MQKKVLLLLILLFSVLSIGCSQNDRLTSGINHIKKADYQKAANELVTYVDIPSKDMTAKDREGKDLYNYAMAMISKQNGKLEMYGFYLDGIPDNYDKHFADEIKAEQKKAEQYRDPGRHEVGNRFGARFYSGTPNQDSIAFMKRKPQGASQKNGMNKNSPKASVSDNNNYSKPLAAYGDYAKNITDTDYSILYLYNGKRTMLYTEGGKTKNVFVADENLVNKIKAGKASNTEVLDTKTVGVAYSFKYEDHLVYALNGVSYVMIINPIDNWVYLYTGVKSDGSYNKYEKLNVLKLEGIEK